MWPGVLDLLEVLVGLLLDEVGGLVLLVRTCNKEVKGQNGGGNVLGVHS